MSEVPESPSDFFMHYVPSRFEQIKTGLAGKSSSGSMTFRVTGDGEWSLRLDAGELRVEPGMRDDVILQVTVQPQDFGPVFVQGARLQASDAPRPEAQLLAFRALTIDAERAGFVRNVQGTVAFVVTDGAERRKLAITPGKAEPKLEAPDCQLECQMSDFLDMQTGKAQPVQLAMSGKIRIVGNAQIPMALSSVFA
jgi:hypothetical protein